VLIRTRDHRTSQRPRRGTNSPSPCLPTPPPVWFGFSSPYHPSRPRPRPSLSPFAGASEQSSGSTHLPIFHQCQNVSVNPSHHLDFFWVDERSMTTKMSEPHHRDTRQMRSDTQKKERDSLGGIVSGRVYHHRLKSAALLWFCRKRKKKAVKGLKSARASYHKRCLFSSDKVKHHPGFSLRLCQPSDDIPERRTNE
jgi:hypothetical protein